MSKAVITAVVLAGLLFVIGVDILHCVAIGLVVIIIGLIATRLEPVDAQPEPDPLPIPYATTLLRSVVFTNPRSSDPIGDNAGRRAWHIWRQAAADFADDPVLDRYADRSPEEWRFLAQRDLVALLDRLDELERASGGRGRTPSRPDGPAPTSGDR